MERAEREEEKFENAKPLLLLVQKLRSICEA